MCENTEHISFVKFNTLPESDAENVLKLNPSNVIFNTTILRVHVPRAHLSPIITVSLCSCRIVRRCCEKGL